MTEFIAGEHAVWRRLRKLFQGNHRAYVAVAFLGSGANRRLRLTRGDTLVVNAGEAAVKRGLTDPSELRKYYRKGVSVYSHDKLHAKVFVSGQTAAVGSANVSQNSESHLSEAIVVTSDRNTVHDAKRFVQNSAYFEIGPEYLKNLEAIYVPPKGSIGGRRKPKGELIWAVQLVTKGWSSTAQSAADKGRPVATRKLSNSRTHKLMNSNGLEKTYLAKTNRSFSSSEIIAGSIASIRLVPSFISSPS